jgi:hypothetical protein
MRLEVGLLSVGGGGEISGMYRPLHHLGFLRGPRGLENHTINLFGFQPLPAIRAATSPAERWIGKA